MKGNGNDGQHKTGQRKENNAFHCGALHGVMLPFFFYSFKKLVPFSLKACQWLYRGITVITIDFQGHECYIKYNRATNCDV